MSERPDEPLQPRDVETKGLLRNAAPEEFADALKGLDFPASKSIIIRTAMDKGGIDREVPHVLDQIDDRTYESMSEVQSEIERVYQAGGGLPVGKPAAPP